jgi:WD40 repeat protein/peroxiredoxin
MPQGNVELFSFPEGELLHRIEHHGAVEALVFSPDGNHLAMGSDVVRVWNCQSHDFATPEFVHPQPVLTLTFSGDGGRLATGCVDNLARVFAIGGESAQAHPLFPPLPHRLRVWTSNMPIPPTFVDQDRGLLTVKDSGDLLWSDASTAELIRLVPMEKKLVHCIAVSPDGRYFAVGGSGVVPLWDIVAGGPAGNDMTQYSHVLSVAFSPDGTTLIAGSTNTVREWSVPDGEPAGPVLRHQGWVRQTACSPDGRLFAAAQIDGFVRVWSTALGNHPTERLPLDGANSAVRLRRDGRYLIPTGSSWDGASLRSTHVYEASTFQAAGPPLRPGGILTDADLSPDGRFAVTLDTTGKAQFWNWRTGERPFSPVAMPSEPRAVRFTPDGRQAIVKCAGGQVLFVDPSTGRVTRRLQHGAKTAGIKPGDGYLDISFDGRRFLSCSNDQLVQVYDTDTGRRCCDPLQHPETARLGRFSSDDRLLLTAADDGTVRIWDATTGGPTRAALAHPISRINDACFSPDGQHVLTASGDCMARLWDWQTGALVCPPFEHAKGVGGVCFTPDGEFVITSAYGARVQVWEWQTGKPVTPPLPITASGLRVLTTPDGSHAVVSGTGSFVSAFSLGDLYRRDELDLDDLCALGEILSAQRIHEGGGEVNLTTDEWSDRWSRFRKLHPEHLPFQWFPEQTIAWHRRQAEKSLRAKQWFGAVWHLDRLVAQEPEDWRHYRDRSRAYGALGQTEAADADQERASALMPEETVLTLLQRRVDTIAETSPEEQRKILDALKAYLAAKADSGLGPEDVRWAMATAESIQRSTGSELAASAYQSFADVIGKNDYEGSVDISRKMQGIARRLMLVGKEMDFQGTKLDGSPLDPAAYEGKVVLVDFWTTWCPHCWPEIANTERNYELYHDRGFEVVAISLDEERRKLEQYLQRNPLPWDVAHTDGAGWKHPMAVHYGISSVPAMFLVGQDGKVVSTQARGTQLNEWLQRLLGPPYIPQGSLAYVDLGSKANQKLGDSVWEDLPENHLGEVPRGEQTFGGVKFRIEDGFVQLGSERVPHKPREVEGIEINRNLTSLYILHGTQFGTVPDRTLIGKYEVVFRGAKDETIPIVCGEDLRDWWNRGRDGPVSRGTFVWEGGNPEVRSKNGTLRLYLTKWTNPRPEEQVASINFVSANTAAAPFCIAITAEYANDTEHSDESGYGN